MGHHQLDALDEQILKLIAGNARIPFWKWQEHVMFPALRSISVFRSLLI